jgi:hypothetical protein
MASVFVVIQMCARKAADRRDGSAISAVENAASVQLRAMNRSAISETHH